jgi:hypothetical protein
VTQAKIKGFGVFWEVDHLDFTRRSLEWEVDRVSEDWRRHGEGGLVNAEVHWLLVFGSQD